MYRRRIHIRRFQLLTSSRQPGSISAEATAHIISSAGKFKKKSLAEESVALGANKIFLRSATNLGIGPYDQQLQCALACGPFLPAGQLTICAGLAGIDSNSRHELNGARDTILPYALQSFELLLFWESCSCWFPLKRVPFCLEFTANLADARSAQAKMARCFTRCIPHGEPESYTPFYGS